MANKYSNLESFTLSVDATKAVLQYQPFAGLSGISKESQGKGFRDWTKVDQEKWHGKLRETVGKNMFIGLRYLASENAFYVRTEKYHHTLQTSITKQACTKR